MFQVAGACECKSGYSGYKCDQCAAGYRQYPDCMTCPCDSRGILPSHDCEGDCICKANVDGEFCDRCKSGYFALTKDNIDGCVPCYCFGATDRCVAGKLYYTMVKGRKNKKKKILDKRRSYLTLKKNIYIYSHKNVLPRFICNISTNPR